MALALQQQRANHARTAVEHLPYTVHVSPHNVRTLERDTLTTIALAGVSHETADADDVQGWHDTLCGLLNNIGRHGDVALWVHTVRMPKSDYPPGEFETPFAAKLNDRYRMSLSGTRLMANQHFVTLLHRGGGGLEQRLRWLERRTYAQRLEEIEDASRKLDELAATMMAALARYTPRRLSTYEEGGKLYSEPAELFGFLLNGEWQRVPVPQAPLRFGLGRSRISFGDERLEIRSPVQRQFGAMLSVGAYATEDTEPGDLDQLLGLPFPFVLTQSFSCISEAKARAMLERQHRLLENAKDPAETQIGAIKTALDELISKRVIFGEHHLSLLVLGETEKALSERLAEADAALQSCGFGVVREDEVLEAAYFSQLPGVFRLRPRPAPISSRNFIGFTGFHNYPQGRMLGNQWGPAVSLLKSSSGTPYYFNFHLPPTSRRGLNENDEDQRVPGHTLILGETGSGKTVVQTFLLAQAEKYRPTVFTFDKDYGQEIYVRAMGGKYFPLYNGKRTGFNPCQLPDTSESHALLEDLIKKCALGDHVHSGLSPSREREVTQAVEANFSGQIPFEDRGFSRLLDFFDKTDPDGMRARLSKWCRVTNGPLAWVFDNEHDEIELAGTRYFGFDVTSFLDNAEVRTPVAMYLFHRLERLIDGRRFIMNMDEFWKMLLDPAFSAKALDAVLTWRKRNALAIFATQSPSSVFQSPISRQLIEQCVTQIYLPGSRAKKEDYVDGFNLSEQEFWEIKRGMVEKGLRGFLLKQRGNSTICELDLHGFDDELAVLSATQNLVEVARGAIAAVGDDPEDWLPVFHNGRKQ